MRESHGQCMRVGSSGLKERSTYLETLASAAPPVPTGSGNQQWLISSCSTAATSLQAYYFSRQRHFVLSSEQGGSECVFYLHIQYYHTNGCVLTNEESHRTFLNKIVRCTTEVGCNKIVPVCQNPVASPH